MNHKQIIQELQRQYPGKKIIKNQEEDPTEIICEIDPTAEHPDYSVAIAVINQSQAHYHRKTKEFYEVVRGKLTYTKDGEEHQLNEGESMEIAPGEVHSFSGDETWVKVTSHPGWTAEDCVLV
jgi:mannose-6-phosphate isomerase-like protein (cupin superfamily)